MVSKNFPLYVKQALGNVPDSWRIRPLPEVVNFQEGPGLRNWQYKDSGVPFLNIRCIRDDGTLDLANVQYVSEEEVLQKYKHFLLEPGDTIISSSGTLGKMAIIRKEHLPLLLNTSIIRFRPLSRDILDDVFMRYFLISQGFKRQFSFQSQGSAQANFGPTHLKEMFIALPPLPEQRKIAAILTSVDDAIAATQRIIDQTERVKRGLMQQLLTRGIGHTKFKKTEIGEIPAEWEVVMLRDVVTHLFRGKSPRYVDYSNLKVINQKCIYWDGFKEQNVKYVDESTITLWDDKYFVRKNDVLLNSTGTGTIGRALLFPFESNEYVIDSHVTCIRTNQSKLLPAFLKYCLEFEENQRRLALTCFTGSTNQIELSKSQLLSFMLALPSMWEQRSINNVLDSIQGKIAIENQYKL